MSELMMFAVAAISATAAVVALALALYQQKRIATLGHACNSLTAQLQRHTQANMGLGRKMKQLEARLRIQESVSPKKGAQHEKGFSQASRLARMGASVDELTNCPGISRSEAELLVSLSRNDVA